MRVSLTRIVERYNFIRNESEKCEYDLIAVEMVGLDDELNMLLDQFTWIEYGENFIPLKIPTYSVYSRSIIP